MATDVIMPQMGESIAEGTIVKWLKKPGEEVKRDEPLFEISTDKVDAEIPSPAAGVLSEILVPEGQTVPINTVVARINGAGARPAQQQPAQAKAETKKEEERPSAQRGMSDGAAAQHNRTVENQEAGGMAKAQQPPPRAAEPARPMTEEEMRKHRSSPLVRKIAREHNVDIRSIEGTGMAGRVTKNDILSFIEGGGQQQPQAAPAVQQTRPSASTPQPAAQTQAPAQQMQPAPPSAPVYQQGERVQVEPMSVMRKRIAEHMVASKRTSAHVTSVFEIDMTRVAKLREQHKDRFFERHGVKLTFTPFIVKAAVEALQAWPVMNASIDGDNIVYKKDINIGVAVALDWGLIVPVVKHADEKNLLGLTRAITDLANRARNKQLKPEEVQGGTFTITNPGIFGSLFGTPIINQPQVAIMGVGTIEKRISVNEDDSIGIRTKCYMSITFDHRLIDGAVADQFMAHVKRSLENFTTTELS